MAFKGTLFYLYRNEGNGLVLRRLRSPPAFTSETRKTRQPLGKGLGIVFTDLNGDTWVDALVANDTARNFAFINQRNGTFREMNEIIGVGVGASGVARSGMGIDIADFRGNGTAGIAVGNFALEMAALFVTKDRLDQPIDENKLAFTDDAIACGIGDETADKLTFGIVLPGLRLGRPPGPAVGQRPRR